MSGTTTTGISLNGWHTASAVTYAEVNRAMAAQATWPRNFSQSDTATGNSISGSFGTWSITTGGSGALIAMALQITGGTVRIAGNSQTLPNFTMTIQVEAGFIPQPGTTIVSAVLQTGQPVQITTTASTLTGLGLTFVSASGFLSLMNTWLRANLGSFNNVFASVDLDADYEQAGMSWLKPSWYSYAVAEQASGATLDNSVFAVLCLIDNTQPQTGLVQQIPAGAIPTGQKAAFLIAPEKFLQHMLMPVLPLMFKDIQSASATSYFTIQGDGLSIRNTADLTMLEVTLENGNKVTPGIGPDDFSISIAGTELVLNMEDMEFEWTPGVKVAMHYEGRSTLGYDSANNIMALTVVSQEGGAEASMEKWLVAVEIVVGIATLITMIVGAVGGVIASGAAKVLEEGATVADEGANTAVELPNLANTDPVPPAQNQATYGPALMGLIKAGSTADQIGALVTRANGCIAAGVIGGILGATATTIVPFLPDIAEGKYDNTPKVTDLANAAVGKTIIWPSSVGGYTLQNATLNGVLQFGLS